MESRRCTEWRSGVTIPGGNTKPASKYARINVLFSSTGRAATLAVVAAPRVVLEQVLLDVRRVEVIDRRAVLGQVPADRTDRFVPAEIAHNRDQKIVPLELAQRAEVQLVGQVAVIQSRSDRSP